MKSIGRMSENVDQENYYRYSAVASESLMNEMIKFLISTVLVLSSLVANTSATETEHEVEIDSFIHTAAGIDFYVEKRGRGPTLVMVTSGQGDSGAYKYLADTLAKDFTVITFDPPGFSRSGPPPSWENLSAKSLGDETAALVKSLGIKKAHFYASSSGGIVVLSLIADHPELVQSAVVHEPAVLADMPIPNFLLAKKVAWDSRNYDSIEDHERATILKNDALIVDPAALQGLGEGHIERRIKNKQIWYDRYLHPDVPCCTRKYTADELKQAPLIVTLGDQSAWFLKRGGKKLAKRGDADLVWHPAKHFPYITMPEAVAEVIRQSAKDNP